MAENVTDHLQVGPSVDLPTGVTVAECVSADHRCGDPSLTSILSDAMTDSSARQWVIWDFRRHKDLSGPSERWTFRLQVTR